MVYPAAYLNDEKKFLEKIFDRYPSIRQAFNDCAAVYPQDRLARMRIQMTKCPRRIWQDAGIPAENCETLAEHTGRMALLANLYPQPHLDYDRTINMISVWGLPLALADEIPLEEMNYEDRCQLRNLSARLVFDHYGDRDSRENWDMLNDDFDGENRWVRDLDFLVTAQQARSYQHSFPELSGRLEDIIQSCQRALGTCEAKAIWKNVMEPVPQVQYPPRRPG